MKALLALSGVIDAISKFFGKIAVYLILICSLVCAGNALSSFFLKWTNNGLLEIQWQMFGGIVLLGAAETLRANEHVRVDLVYGAVSPTARLWIDIIGIIFFLLPATTFFAIISWPFFYASFLNGEHSPNAGGLILWPVKFIIFFGFVLITLQGVSELIKRIAAFSGRLALDTSYEKPLQ